ncbi:hypothetical protein ACPYO6_12325 [Georgenia sp. Z1344]|uniref:hypothetical protein n=1 Tax=Georgenia sp. Z1344 TaxID=3416706 RepID=UPI003CEA9B45
MRTRTRTRSGSSNAARGTSLTALLLAAGLALAGCGDGEPTGASDGTVAPDGARSSESGAGSDTPPDDDERPVDPDPGSDTSPSSVPAPEPDPETEETETRTGSASEDAAPSGDRAPAPDGALALSVTYPDAWEEQSAAAANLPPGSLAMATATADGTIAGSTVVVEPADGPVADMPGLLAARGNDPASIVEAGTRDVAGESVTRWEARSTSGEWDTIAYPVPGPDGVVVLVMFVVTAERTDVVEEDVATVLDSLALG